MISFIQRDLIKNHIYHCNQSLISYLVKVGCQSPNILGKLFLLKYFLVLN